MKKAKRIALVFFVILMVLSLTGIVAARKRSPSRSPRRYHRPYPYHHHPHCFITTAAEDSGQVAILTELKKLLVGH